MTTPDMNEMFKRLKVALNAYELSSVLVKAQRDSIKFRVEGAHKDYLFSLTRDNDDLKLDRFTTLTSSVPAGTFKTLSAVANGIKKMDDKMYEGLYENEHTLVSPELIGTDQEKVAAIQFWSDAVKLLRSLNTLVISYKNKQALLDAMEQELKTVETEIKNSSGIPTDDKGIPAIEQPLASGETEQKCDSCATEPAPPSAPETAPVVAPTPPPVVNLSVESRETLQKLSGNWQPKPKELTEELLKLRRAAGIKVK